MLHARHELKVKRQVSFQNSALQEYVLRKIEYRDTLIIIPLNVGIPKP